MLLTSSLAPLPVAAQSAPTCPCSIWSSTAAPVNASANDNNGVELGVKFQSDTTGYITGIRFYKGAGNTGTHVGNLWSSTGALLARATFATETASGWQQVTFVNAVAVTPNTTYVASYYAPAGHYAADGAVFTSAGVDNAPLHALSNSASGGNGVYAYGSSTTFPNGSYNATNYWVDVVFNTTAPAPVPPTITNVQATGTGPTGTTITWTTNEVSDSQVNYGTTSAYGSSTPINSALTTSHSVALSGLTPGTQYHVQVKSKDLAGQVGTSADSTFTTTAAASCPCSIWPSSTAPVNASTNDSTAYELGVKFQSDTAGYITGVRFYKGSGNTGTHIGNLWSGSGALLASATFSGETASGWQTVTFPNAVAITANTTYVASYFDPAGHYAADANTFATAGVDNAPLHALSTTAAGGNGLYVVSSASAFPTQTYNATNYWVDVVFNATAPAPVPPTITNVQAGNISSSSATITWTTNEVADSQVSYGTTSAYGSSSALNASPVTSHSVTIGGLAAGTLYHYQAKSKDLAGLVGTSADFTFTTAAAPTCPCTVWPSTAAPVSSSTNDGRGVELGVKFTSEIAGYVSGIRFYKGAGNTGAHTGSLWTTSGTRLVGATFSSETASGWQQVTFASPVAITANTTYIASYFAPVGHYAADGNVFTSAGVDNPPLHALSSSAAGGNGVFSYASTSQFPTSTYNGGNYWVDLVFTTTTPVPSTTGPVLSGISAITGVASSTTAVVNWTSDMASDSQVEYGTTISYGSSTTLDSSLVFAHSVTVTGLSVGTTYHYRVKSKDNAGNLTVSGDFTFVTPNPAAVGQWSSLMNWPLVAVHSSVMPNGKVLVWDAWETGGTPSARVWDPASNTFTSVPDMLAQIFCSAQVGLSDGRIFVIGGHNGAENGITSSNIFDPNTNTWSNGPKMAFPRWYPGATKLADGRVVTVSGEITQDVFADAPEVFDPVSNTWRVVNVDTHDMQEGNYPTGFVLPNGKLLEIGPQEGITRFLDVDAQTWTTAVAQVSPILNGTAVMYQPGKILYAGGFHNGATDTTTALLDMTQATPAWQVLSPMAFPRAFHNLTALPDGKVLATGGSYSNDIGTTVPGPLAAEMWDPTSQTWSTMAAEQNPRMYHSTAVLLPDARVLVAGGGRLPPSNDYLTAEIYSPPYLFKGTRPAISSAPATATYGSTITVQTPDAASIGSVSIVALPTDTHNNNMDQRFVPATFTAGPGSLSVQMPNSGNIAPPGYYMLFIVNSSGVPSVASIVQVQAAVTTTAPALTAVSAGNITGEAATVTWGTDRVANTQVDYGLTTAYGTTSSDPNHTTIHSMSLVNLSANTTYHFRVRSTDAWGNTAVSGDNTFVTSAAPVCPCNIWHATDAPAAFGNDGTSIETGVKFTADANGYINGIRFYKGAGSSGTHVGNLWTSTGTLLASATFTNETASGWQQVTFSSPVAVTAGTTYVASTFSAGGGYASTSAAFAPGGVDNPPVHALSYARAVGNGLYRYGASGFPTGVFDATNYWVDIVFTFSGSMTTGSTTFSGGGGSSSSTGASDSTPSLGGTISAASLDPGATVNWTTDATVPLLAWQPATLEAARRAKQLGVAVGGIPEHDASYWCPIARALARVPAVAPGAPASDLTSFDTGDWADVGQLQTTVTPPVPAGFDNSLTVSEQFLDVPKPSTTRWPASLLDPRLPDLRLPDLRLSGGVFRLGG